MPLFPRPELQGEIQFICMKSWPYRFRMTMIILLMITGLAVQLLANYWIGLLFLCAGSLLGLIRGYRAKPQLTGSEIWSRVTPDEFAKIKSKAKQLKAWDRDAFDITNKFGCTLFFIILLAFFISFGIIAGIFSSHVAVYISINGFVVLFPHWVTGVRTYLNQDRLIIKIKLLEYLMKQLAGDTSLQVQPMLSVQKTKDEKQVPKDVRLMLRLVNAPEAFMGIQVQIAINTVQGTDYPYLYCVLLADQKSGLFDKRSIVSPSRKIVIEDSKSADVQVLVVRQKTTQKSGYHTSQSDSLYVVSSAIQIAKELIGLENKKQE